LLSSVKNINQSINELMKTLKFNWLTIIFALLVIMTGCKDDDKEVSKFVGDFVINKAELAEALTVPIVEDPGNFTVPVGTNITPAIQTALLSAVSCSSPDKSYVELREDNSLYLSCEGSSPLSAGTWEEMSASSLKLNMNSSAIPPVGFVLTVTDIVEDANGLTGITIVPLPKLMIEGIIASMQLTLDPSAPVLFMVKISIEFKKK
jgi:hypothetical protein